MCFIGARFSFSDKPLCLSLILKHAPINQLHLFAKYPFRAYVDTESPDLSVM